MEFKEAAALIEDLREQINYHNKRYYLDDSPEISDQAFDDLLAKLVELEAAFPELKTPDSPSQRVGGDITKVFPTVAHTYPMLSLSNSYNEQDLIDFDARVKKTIGNDFDYVCELKFDGVAISLTYENGVLVKGVTRGDGVQGDEITANVRTIRSLPLKVQSDKLPPLFEVRGEVFMDQENFKRINQEIADQNLQREKAGNRPLNLLANPRNATSGTLKMQDSRMVATRKLDCYVYSLLGDGLPFETHEEGLTLLSDWGFNVSDSYKRCADIKEVLQFIENWQEKRHGLPLATDGIVVKVNSLQKQEMLGATAKSPRWAMAYKYKAESATTTLLDVTYQVGRTGAITPVAQLDTVQLAGTTVKRASLHNANEIARLDLHLGDQVYVEKGGEIIPKVTGVDKRFREGRQLVAVAYLKNCPACGSQLVRAPGEAVHFCLNSAGCPPQIRGKIEHFIQRKAMDVASLGPETIEQLLQNNLISNPADLYSLRKEDLLSLDRFGEKSADNLLAGVERSMKVPFQRLLFGLGIRFVGATVAEKLALSFQNMDNLMQADTEQLVAVPEIGERIAESVHAFFKVPENIAYIEKLRSANLQFEIDPEVVTAQKDTLIGKSFVISGVFEQHSRDQLKQLIIEHNGKVVSAISGKVDYLLAGENMGPAKLAKAQKLKVAIISESDFIRIIESAQVE